MLIPFLNFLLKIHAFPDAFGKGNLQKVFAPLTPALRHSAPSDCPALKYAGRATRPALLFLLVMIVASDVAFLCPRGDSDPRLRFRKPVLCPLSYAG